jgi:hypothetical protein
VAEVDRSIGVGKSAGDQNLIGHKQVYRLVTRMHP